MSDSLKHRAALPEAIATIKRRFDPARTRNPMTKADA